MKILIGCEESQATCSAFRKLGFEAYSCDLLECSGGHPEWHLKMDVFKAIEGGELELQNGDKVHIDKWTMMLGHPTCTMLAVSGAQWLSHPDDKHLPFEERRPNPKYPSRREDMLKSVEFVKALYDSNIEHIAIENPIGLLSSRWKKPNQIVQPWMFGDEASKSTCLWLKNLPEITPTNVVGKGEKVVYSSGKSHPKWYADALVKAKTKEERQTLRSKTFQGMADAFASQWGAYLLKLESQIPTVETRGLE